MNEKRPRVGTTGGVVDTALPSNSTTLRPSDQTPAVAIQDKLVWSVTDVCGLLGVSARLVERERAAGRWPPVDVRVGRRVFWFPATIRRHLEGLARGGGR
jgi:hypothetical protein